MRLLVALSGCRDPDRPSGCTAARLDGDGYDELMLASGSTTPGEPRYAARIAVHPGSPDGPAVEAASVLTASAEGCDRGASLALGDFDGDGLDDVAAGFEPDDLDLDAFAILLGEGAWSR